MTTHVSFDARPSAILWDFDGTLVDTEPYWVSSEIEVMAKYRVLWTTEQGEELSGFSWQNSMTALRAEATKQSIEIPESDFELYTEIYQAVTQKLRDNPVPWRPGAQELLQALEAEEMPMALISASPMEMLNAGLDRMGREHFQTIVDGQSVTHGKPHPEGYITAANRLGVDPRDCLAIEDSRSGTEAARRSGAVVLAVPNVQELSEAPGQRIHATLDTFTPDALRRLYAEVDATGERQ